MWGTLLNKLALNDNKGEISLFDVKELYDAAYAEKAKARVNLKKYRILIQKAQKMDILYRNQLIQARVLKFGEAA